MFAILAELDEADGKKGKSTKKPKKDAVDEKKPVDEKKSQLTSEQRKILAARKAARDAKKAAKAAAAAEAEKCHFYAECGRKREGEYPYCRGCWVSKTKKCECGGEIRLAGGEAAGSHHKKCASCRRDD